MVRVKGMNLDKERRALQLSTSCVIPYIIHVFIIWWVSFERRSTREFWICTWSHDGLKHTVEEQKKTVIWRKRPCTQNYSLKMMNTEIQAIWLIIERCARALFDIIFLLTFFPPFSCVCCSCVFITQHIYVALDHETERKRLKECSNMENVSVAIIQAMWPAIRMDSSRPHTYVCICTMLMVLCSTYRPVQLKKGDIRVE